MYRWRPKKAAHRDANEADIIRELTDRGATVICLDSPVDLIVGYLGRWTMVEVKSKPGALMRPAQQQFLDRCALQGLRAVVMDDLDDCDVFFPVVLEAPPSAVV